MKNSLFALVRRRVWCWFVGNIIVLRGRYDRKYFKSCWFRGNKSGRFAEGWEWVYYDFFECKRAGVNLDVRWPCSSKNQVLCPDNIFFSPHDLNNFQGFGKYFQAIGEIHIGEGTFIANNVGIITQNHDIYDPSKRGEIKPVIIGRSCWLGMNSVILPGVILGDHTVVGAGAVVNKPFPNGNCIVGGVPATIIKKFDNQI